MGLSGFGAVCTEAVDDPDDELSMFCGVTFSLDFGPTFLFCLISPYLNPLLLSLTDYIGLPCLFLLSLITPIFD